MTSTTRTARCGPACRVVWEGNGQDFWPSPIPISKPFMDKLDLHNGYIFEISTYLIMEVVNIYVRNIKL